MLNLTADDYEAIHRITGLCRRDVARLSLAGYVLVPERPMPELKTMTQAEFLASRATGATVEVCMRIDGAMTWAALQRPKQA